MCPIRATTPEAQTFVTIGERIHCISPSIRRAMDERDPGPILKRAAEQIAAGATYLDVNIGPAEKDGPERMMWAVQLLQQNFNNVPLALDTANKKAIEAGIKVYNRSNGKPIVNSADAGSRIENIDLAAANDAIVIALCSADGIAKDNEERMMHCHNMLERGLSLGMEATDLWFDPLFLVVKGMQDKQMDVLNAIKLFRRRRSEVHWRPVQQLQRRSQDPAAHYGRHPGGHGHDAGPHLRHREPLRPAPDGDHQDLRHHQEPRAVLRLLSEL